MFSSLDGLSVVDHIVRSPGEFYAEKWYVPYFAKRVLGNHYNYREKDPTGDMWYICHITEAERIAFPDLKYVSSVGIRYEGNKCNSWVRSCSWQKR